MRAGYGHGRGREAGQARRLTLYADAFEGDYERLRAAGARFEETPRREPYGTVAVFQGLYVNRWDLLQPQNNDACGIISDQT